MAPDERFALSPTLYGPMNRAYPGYGVSVDPALEEAWSPGLEDDGIWKVDLETGRSELLLSFAEIVPELERAGELVDGTPFGFHVKINTLQTRIMYYAQMMVDGRPRKPAMVTCDIDGANIRVPVTSARWAGGHHPNWHPDGERIIMNLLDHEGTLRFHQFRYDGSEMQVLAPRLLGSGHPSFHHDGRCIVTDAYPHEPVCINERVPIRLIDAMNGTEEVICWMWTLGSKLGVLRLDPHPVWSRDFTQVCFNGAPNGNRQLFVADLLV